MSTKINKTNKLVNANKTTGKDIVLYILYLLLLLLPQYFKGGYFENIYLPFIICISIFMVYYIISNYKGNGEILIKSKVDFILLLLVLIYSLTYFFGINKRGSIIEFAKYASFLSIFLITRDIHKNNNIRGKTIDLIIFSGIVISIIGIGTMIGTWEYPASYNGNRLSSMFQYPNTLAVYSAAMYFLSIGQALVEDNAKKIGIYGGGLFIFFSTLIFTYSRGMWVLFPVLLLGFFIVLSVSKKVELFFYSLGSILVAAPISFLFLKYVETGNPSKLWGLYIGGIVLSALILYLLANTTKFLSRISWKTLTFAILAIGICVLLLLGMAIKSIGPIAYENNTDEQVLSRLTRTVKNVYPNTNYEIKVKGNAINNSEDSFAGRVIVYSVNENIKHTNLGSFDILDNGDFELSIPITTLEDTNALTIYFQNQMPRTSIVFSDAKIKDLETEDVEQIPLKYKYIPETIVRRVIGIGTTDNSLQARVTFSKDALKLAKKRFLFGIGGQGWATAYRSVQSYPYWSKQVHNHYLQTFVEVGIIGFGLFILFLLGLLYRYLKYKKSEASINHKTIADTLIISAGTILAHAAIDFDLALVGLYIILWALLGILHSMTINVEDELKLFSYKLNKKVLRGLNVVVIITTLLALVFSSTIYGGRYFINKAVKAEEMEELDEMELAMEKAVLLDPYNTSYRSDLIDTYIYLYDAKQDDSYGYEAKVQTDKLLKIGKYDPFVLIKGGENYFKFGLIEEGFEILNRSLRMQPLVTKAYLQNTNSYLGLFNHYINQENFDMAKETAEKGLENTQPLLLESNQRSLRPMAKNNKLFYQLSELKYYANEFDDFISYFERAYRLKYYYDFNLDVDGDDKIELVSIWNAEGGNLEYMRDTNEELIKLNNSGEKYGVFDVLSFNLEPEKTYLVTFDARGDMTPDKATFYIMDTKSQERLQTPSTPIELGSQWNTYEIEFTTQGDIGEDTSRARFVIGGENNGDMDLRNIKIFEKIN